MYTYHLAFKYLVKKTNVGGDICWWLLLFHEFDFEDIFKHDRLNLGPHHLLRVKNGQESGNLYDSLHNVKLFAITIFDDQYIDITQFLSMGYAPPEFTTV